MNKVKLFDAEYRLMDILWHYEPISCADISKICEEKLGWKRTTTYTQIKRMEERMFLRRDGSILVALIKRNEVERFDSEEIINGRFSGSLPRFVAAFIDGKGITKKEIAELRRMLDQYEGD